MLKNDVSVFKNVYVVNQLPLKTQTLCAHSVLWKGFVTYPVKWQKNWQLPMGALLFLEVGFKLSIRAVSTIQHYSA